MTAAEFRKIALSLPEAVAGAHMGHADFRVGGKIFATLGPDETWGMVKLLSDQQGALIHSDPHTYSPAAGAWGRRGATIIALVRARKQDVRKALKDAWANTAPARLLKS